MAEKLVEDFDPDVIQAFFLDNILLSLTSLSILITTDKYTYRSFYFMILTSLCFLLQSPLSLIYLLLENQMSIRYSNSYQPSHAQEMSLVVLTSKGD